jgi:hypothetical protein
LAVALAPLSAPGAKPKKPAEPPRLAVTGPKGEPVKPPSPEELEKSIQRGIQFLLERQNPNGSWGSARNTKGLNIYAPVPGAHYAFRAAVTSLCVSALIELDDGSEEMARAIEKGEAWLLAFLPRVRRATGDALYNSWAHAYALQALVRMLDRHKDHPKLTAEIRQRLDEQIDMLTRYECVDGGWCYYDFNYQTRKPSGSSISFVSAAVLVGLYEAREAGVEVPQRIVDRAIASIHRQRLPDFSYCYGEYLKLRPMHPINRPPGSLGRSQACNLALRLWGDKLVTDEVLKTWLERLFARNGWLSMGRKRPIPHESWAAVAAYFYYFGHYYAAWCIEQLPPKERTHFQGQLAAIIIDLQEKDGSWFDFPFYDYHQQYGTAFALMTLGRCRQGEQ